VSGPVTAELPAGVRRLFTEGFQVGDIAGPLASFDAEIPGPAVAAVMDRNELAVVGIRRDGRVAGFVERDGLGQGPCGVGLKEFAAQALLPQSAPLSAAVRVLAVMPQVFVTAFGEVAGVVVREDLHKAPARMWLFGMVTMIELRYTRLIAEHCPDDSWRELLSEGRLRKAEELLAERNRRNRVVILLDCLQLSDKGTIVAKCEAIRRQTIFTSRRQAEDGIKLLEGLRNNLAHAQDVVATDWEAIVQLSGHVDRAIGDERSPAHE
jgi:hypothetical protein